MKNERQLVLFLKKGSKFNQTQVAAKINEKFEELGNPAILPVNDKNPMQPLIIFNQGIMNITMNYNDVSFIFLEENFEKCFNLIIDIMDLLDDLSFDFVRLGYVSTYIGNALERNNFKDKMFKDDSILKEDFQLAWYSKTTIDSVLVNVWERHFTDFVANVEFVSIFDINTPIDEEYNVSCEFVEDFLKKCDLFIKKKMENMLK